MKAQKVKSEPNMKFNPMGIMATIREQYGAVADTDSYKMTHHAQYPKGAKRMVSYIESRGGKHDTILFFGLQLLIKEFFLQQLTHEQVDNIVAFEKVHLMDNCTDDLEIALRAVVNEYDGWFPVRIRAAEEGLLIPIKNVVITVESTVDDERLFSLVSYFETKLVRVWSPTTIATESYAIREVILSGLKRTSDDAYAEIPFKLHDFGSRGISSSEGAAFAGAGHLVSFLGSDTVLAVLAANIGYNCEMSSFSIPASEHSTTTMHGREGEEQLITQMFDAYAKPGAIFATVIDSYDWVNWVRKIAPKFKDRLEESGATWVFRPDSGDPVQTPVQVVRELGKVFGYTVNKAGFKVLNNVRVIQGDGIDIEDVKAIVALMIRSRWSITNIAFGMGGGLLQKNNRDTQKFAMKCCAVQVGNEWVDVFKEPSVYDPKNWKLDPDASSFKKSKKGRLELMYNTQTEAYRTVPVEDANEKFGWVKALHTVYENGVMTKELTMDQVRRNAGIID
jgi:nicotinamide phosphoribosyltransferase